MAIDIDNVQGNILAGFNTRFQCFLCLRFGEDPNLEVMRSWAGRLADEVSSFRQVKAQRGVIRDSAPNAQLTWVMAAIGYRLVSFLRPDAKFLSRAFRNGFRSRRHGVMADDTDLSSWAVGGLADNEADILFVIAGNDKSAVEARADELEDAGHQAGLKSSYREMGIRLEDEQEHFGFRDGIAQPKVDLQEDGNGIPAGQFIFGHKDLDAKVPHALHMQLPAELNSDGTLISFRRLRQDVKEFRTFRDAQLEKLKANWPDLTAEHLEALIVGRWPKGQLVSVQNPSAGELPPDIDGFDFSEDLDAEGCPFTAHIRTVNPRNGGGDVVKPERRQFLRRGIPFGTPYTDETAQNERGLLFVALQTEIERQVDFVTQIWMNSQDRPNIGNDLLVGRGFAPRRGTLAINRGSETAEISTDANRWVTPTGGAYFFAPSIKGLRSLGHKPEGEFIWRARAVTGTIRNAIEDAIRFSPVDD